MVEWGFAGLLLVGNRWQPPQLRIALSVDPIRNPYTPSAGARPDELAGRDEEGLPPTATSCADSHGPLIGGGTAIREFQLPRAR